MDILIDLKSLGQQELTDPASQEFHVKTIFFFDHCMFLLPDAGQGAKAFGVTFRLPGRILFS